jgi:phosphatidate cytidylyltransferase
MLVLRWRLLIATIIILPLLALLWADCQWNFDVPGIWVWPLPVAATVLGVAEVLALLAAKNHQPVGWAVHGGALLIAAGALLSLFGIPVSSSAAGNAAPGQMGGPVIGFFAGLVLILVAEMQRYRPPRVAIVNAALGVFTLAYIALPMSFVILLRLYHDSRWGMAAIVSLVFVTKMSDTGAYFFGRMLGRHKMTPQLSPGKTIEGGIGGLLTACASSLLFFHLLLPWIVGTAVTPPSLWACLTYALVLTVAGMVGDLAESLLKRDMDQKDSSRWMPGLGGVLDILDSLLLAAPAGYLCWISGMLGP